MNNTSFIFGVPRSGTTLLANIVNSHPNAISLIEPHLSIKVNNHYIHENYERKLTEDPIDFLKNYDGLGCLKETFRSKWLKPSFENKETVDSIVKNVDSSLAIIRDVRAVWCSTIKTWNTQRENISMYKECWLDFIDFINSSNIKFIKYEDLVKRNVSSNDIFEYFDLRKLDDFKLKKRSVNQPGDDRAEKSEKINQKSLDNWKSIIKESEKKYLEKRCKSQLENFNYL